MIVLLDTNVLVSALIFPQGPANILYQAWRDGRFDLLTSEEQLDEFRQTTCYPRVRKLIRPAEAGTVVNEMRSFGVFTEKLPFVDRSADPADNFLLAMAQAGKADFLVRKDKSGVLVLLQHGRTHIVTPHEMLAVLRQRPSLPKNPPFAVHEPPPPPYFPPVAIVSESPQYHPPG